MFSPIEIGTRISSARSIKSMTLEEVASKVGVAKSTFYYSYEPHCYFCICIWVRSYRPRVRGLARRVLSRLAFSVLLVLLLCKNLPFL